MHAYLLPFHHNHIIPIVSQSDHGTMVQYCSMLYHCMEQYCTSTSGTTNLKTVHRKVLLLTDRVMKCQASYSAVHKASGTQISK